jgi:hypothetical protein
MSPIPEVPPVTSATRPATEKSVLIFVDAIEATQEKSIKLVEFKFRAKMVGLGLERTWRSGL